MVRVRGTMGRGKALSGGWMLVSWGCVPPSFLQLRAITIQTHAIAIVKVLNGVIEVSGLSVHLLGVLIVSVFIVLHARFVELGRFGSSLMVEHAIRGKI